LILIERRERWKGMLILIERRERWSEDRDREKKR
jgi:hypothetical protein